MLAQEYGKAKIPTKKLWEKAISPSNTDPPEQWSKPSVIPPLYWLVEKGILIVAEVGQ